MTQRCHNPSSSSYENYGARGITVCERWRGNFLVFLEDMGHKPSASHTIERIDNNAGYSPSNCRWATKSEQLVNQRLRADNTSGYRGVVWDKANRNWVARINVEGHCVGLGRYHDPMEAAYVRDQAALQLHGPHAYLNVL